jgi:hypothetical protein
VTPQSRLEYEDSYEVLCAFMCWYGGKSNLQFLFYFFFFSTGAWTQSLHLEPLHHPLFVMGFSI